MARLLLIRKSFNIFSLKWKESKEDFYEAFSKLFASLALLTFLSVVFMSCDNPSSSDNSTNNNTDAKTEEQSDTTPATQVREVFVGSYEDAHGDETAMITDTVTFETDGTFSVYEVTKQEDVVVFEATVAKGTYSGNASVDGVIVITMTYIFDDDSESLIDVADVPEYPYSDPIQITIQDGKFTLPDSDFEYIRQ